MRIRHKQDQNIKALY